MGRWGRAWLLALILLGVCSGAVIVQAKVLTSQVAGPSGMRPATASDTRPGASSRSGYFLTAASSGPVLATTSAVLSQDRENDLWRTTVILSQVGAECPLPASEFWLETTSPDGTIQASGAVRVGQGPCRMTVTFTGAPRTMEGASLVLYEAGAVSSVQLTLNRNVTLSDYFFIPAICGLVLAIALLLAIGFFVGIHEEDGSRVTLNDRRFLVKKISKSQVPRVKLVPVATIVATVLGASTLAGSLFPGVSIGIFLALATGVAAVATAGGSFLFELLDVGWVRRHAPNEIGASLALTSGGNQPNFSFPAGASIQSADKFVMAPNQVSAKIVILDNVATVSLPSKFMIPEGSEIDVIEAASLSFLEGPKILLKGARYLRLSNADAKLPVGEDSYNLPRIIKAESDTTIEYNDGKEPVFSPSGAKAGRRRYGRRKFNLTLERHDELQTNMLIALVPLFAVIFAAGAELGVIGVLSIGFSDATGFNLFLVADLIALVALIVIWYVVWRIQHATYAQPSQLQPGAAKPLP
jgi:hypothetical protein